MTFGAGSFAEVPFATQVTESETITLDGQAARFLTGTLILGGHSSVTFTGVGARYLTGSLSVVGQNIT